MSTECRDCLATLELSSTPDTKQCARPNRPIRQVTPLTPAHKHSASDELIALAYPRGTPLECFDIPIKGCCFESTATSHRCPTLTHSILRPTYFLCGPLVFGFTCLLQVQKRSLSFLCWPLTTLAMAPDLSAIHPTPRRPRAATATATATTLSPTMVAPSPTRYQGSAYPPISPTHFPTTPPPGMTDQGITSTAQGRSSLCENRIRRVL